MVNQPNILVIKSDPKELRKVHFFLLDFFKKNDVANFYFNRALLCISEAVINSIEHGNQFDITKTVTIKILYSNNEMDVEIYDEGEGFDISIVDDPTYGDNIKKESGRGIYIIRALSDFIKYNRKGNSVLLKIDCR